MPEDSTSASVLCAVFYIHLSVRTQHTIISDQPLSFKRTGSDKYFSPPDHKGTKNGGSETVHAP